MFDKLKKMMGFSKSQETDVPVSSNTPVTQSVVAEKSKEKTQTVSAQKEKDSNFEIRTTERPYGNLYEIDDKKRNITFVLDVQCKAGDTKIPLSGNEDRNTDYEWYEIKDGIVKDVDYNNEADLGKLNMSVSLSAKRGDVVSENFHHEITALQNNKQSNFSTTDISLMLYNNIKDAIKNSKDPEKKESAKLIQGFLKMVDDPIMQAPKHKKIEKLREGIKLHGNGNHDENWDIARDEEDLRENRKRIRYRKSDKYKQEQEEKRIAEQAAKEAKAKQDEMDKRSLAKAIKDLKAADLFK